MSYSSSLRRAGTFLAFLLALFVLTSNLLDSLGMTGHVWEMQKEEISAGLACHTIVLHSRSLPIPRDDASALSLIPAAETSVTDLLPIGPAHLVVGYSSGDLSPPASVIL